ncbi:MAG: tRNA epoxyqueuosine(34) reductase QueG [Xanthomonadales bacterium]|nr:tRNA epoxyqueuosine(34) reductase QueG [Xanthomonadales bacterium]
MKNHTDYHQLKQLIKDWATQLGFQQCGISDIELSQAGEYLNKWLANKYHGNMDYMHRHGSKRYHPEQLLPQTLTVISVRLDYMPPNLTPYQELLDRPNKAAVSRYALGRDYHKVIRQKLKKMTQKIEQQIGDFGHRVFTDSAPVMEKAIAEKAGLGWIGKHSNLINSKTGSYFFLGEIYTDLPLEPDKKATFHCGTCTQCIQDCPTNAIVSPFQVDARRCISYLTIENKGEIPIEFRKAMGNRIYGCDDCQMVCPWNKFTQNTQEQDFHPRHQLDDTDLLTLFKWTEQEFLNNTEGSPIRRIGYHAWQRNIAVALGNAKATGNIIEALQAKLNSCSDMVKTHIEWALGELVG